jgi:CcmD family protein
MKFFSKRTFLTIVLFQHLYLPLSWAQGTGDFMRDTGKIGVVVGVVLLIFLGLILYLVRLDRKLTKLEHQIKDDHEWKD